MKHILKLFKIKHFRAPLILLAIIVCGFGVYKSYIFINNLIADKKL